MHGGVLFSIPNSSHRKRCAIYPDNHNMTRITDWFELVNLLQCRYHSADHLVIMREDGVDVWVGRYSVAGHALGVARQPFCRPGYYFRVRRGLHPFFKTLMALLGVVGA